MGTAKTVPLRRAAPVQHLRDVSNPMARARLLEQVFEQSGEAIIVKDLDGVVTFWNREAASLYGFTAEEAIGRPLRALHAADLTEAEYARILSRIRAGKPTSSTGERRKKNGETVRVAIKTTPLVDARGENIGEITVVRDVTLLHRTEEALRSAQSMLEAKVAAVGESNRNLAATVRQLEAYHRTEEALSEMSEVLQACTERAEAYNVIRDTATELFPGVGGALYIFRESRDVLERVSSWGAAKDPEAVLTPDSCWALRLGRPHSVRRLGGVRCAHASETAQRYVCMPVQGQGQVLGLLHFVIESGARTGRLPLETERRLHALSDSVGPALANLRLRDALRVLALHDGLTGMYNRRYMEDALQRELNRSARSGKPVAFIMIDIDHFKRFNDTFGHDAGDFVLNAVARAITTSIRATDIACRYGGEELAVVLGETDRVAAVQRAEALRAAIRGTNLTHRGQSLPGPAASIGVAVYPEHAGNLVDLVKAADQALYRAKQAGRDRVCVAEATPP
jgi:diguanylate cyclase (GGDEF)-like protein/PAS domain S-box-containing protein